jgi:hypothetical protein
VSNGSSSKLVGARSDLPCLPNCACFCSCLSHSARPSNGSDALLHTHTHNPCQPTSSCIHARVHTTTIQGVSLHCTRARFITQNCQACRQYSVNQHSLAYTSTHVCSGLLLGICRTRVQVWLPGFRIAYITATTDTLLFTQVHNSDWIRGPATSGVLLYQRKATTGSGVLSIRSRGPDIPGVLLYQRRASIRIRGLIYQEQGSYHIRGLAISEKSIDQESYHLGLGVLPYQRRAWLSELLSSRT